MAAGSHDIYIEQGATYELQITCGSLGAIVGGNPTIGTPKDFTGCSAAMQIRERIDGPVLVELVTDDIYPPGRTEGDGLTLGGADGTINVLISWDKTAAIAVKKGVYDIFVYYPDETVYRPLKGNVSVDFRVTKD